MSSFDTVSLSSLGPNATTIKVPYKPELLNESDKVESHKRSKRKHNKTLYSSQDSTLKEGTKESGLNEMNMQEDIEKLRKRLASINSNTITISRDDKAKRRDKNDRDKQQHFDYKTMVANVQPAPLVPRQHVVDAYNVRVIEHNSPFNNKQHQPVKSVSELSESIARLELLSGDNLEASGREVGGTFENNNEVNFNLNEFIKYNKPIDLINNLENDNISLVSSCSLRSSRTYDIRAQDQTLQDDEDFNDAKHFPVEVRKFDSTNQMDNNEDDENKQEEKQDEEKRGAAWVFDLRDGSSTAIVAPARPKKPELPKIASKTEDLAQSKGGRSYYLELVELEKKQQERPKQQEARKRPRPSSIDSLYSRWNSHSTLSGVGNNQHHSSPSKSPSISISKLNTENVRKSRQIIPASILDANSRPICSTSSINQSNTQLPTRRQLPFSGSPGLSNRSKSSSCLIGSTRASKYSIYGGLRKPNSENKPVPRLSYSRAIGPKSQRQIDAQPKTPSRYLKMK